ncbi:hypothetical protein ACRALDRAFT_1068199 [Sodiomyces alcalophilus JCM 7366]|uniref:uncharacterized protein n=1 Tax=Sodiomyces alcalophilus JCM 7366 TaxID=591952 RepID=UPI0039B6017B
MARPLCNAKPTYRVLIEAGGIPSSSAAIQRTYNVFVRGCPSTYDARKETVHEGTSFAAFAYLLQPGQYNSQEQLEKKSTLSSPSQGGTTLFPLIERVLGTHDGYRLMEEADQPVGGESDDHRDLLPVGSRD